VRARAICAAAKCDPTELAEQVAIAAALRARR
jgi:hypothetical protein